MPNLAEYAQRVVDSIPLGLLTLSADLRVLSANRWFMESIRLRSDELIGRRLDEVIYADGLKEQATEVSRGGDYPRCVVTDVAVAGRRESRPARITIALMAAEDEGRLILVFEELTQSEPLQASDEASRRRFRQLVDMLPAAVYVCNSSGVIEFYNRRAAELWGREPIRAETEQLFCGSYKLYRPDGGFLSREESSIAEVLRTGLPARDLELVIERPDGSRITALANVAPIRNELGEIVGAINCLQDVTERKKAEEALRESETRLRALIENSSDGLALISSDGTILDAGPSTARILGYSQQEFVGRNLFDLIHPDELQSTISLFTELVRKPRNVAPGQRRVRHKDGSWRWIEGVADNLLPEPSVRAIVANYRDITERKHAEEALRASEERYRLLFERNLAGVFRSSLDGRILECNDSMARILGYDSREELFALTTWDIHFSRADREAKLALLKERGSLTNFEVCFRRKDGTAVWVLANLSLVKGEKGTPAVLEGTLIDITERKQAEEALRASVERYRPLFESNPHPMWVYDLETLHFLAVNEAAVHHYGYSQEEFLAMTIKDIRPPEDVPALLERISRVTAGIDRAGIWRHRKKDGTVIVVEITSHALLFAGRRAEVVLANDITERRQLEEQLRQSHKMEAVGRLAGGVAHDFNNLLTAISGYSELLLERLSRRDPLRRLVNGIKKAGDQASSLTTQLLAFSRQQVLQPKVLELNAVIRDMESMLRRLIGEDIELVIVPKTALARVKADPMQIEEVILNLAVNARDAMPHGGTLAIAAEDVDLDKALADGGIAAPAGRYVTLTVRDTGMGIDPETQTHIFEPFFTTKEEGKGTGLGLATVYGIVKQSGGHIGVHSEPGRGTTFKIYLPRVEEPVERVEVHNSPAGSHRGSETILLVEDELLVREVAATVLRERGYKVLEARHGEEAVAISKRYRGPIHMLLTDVVMPRMSGHKLAELLAPMRPEMRVLYMSGYKTKTIQPYGVVDTDASFLQKPFPPGTLARKVREVLDAEGGAGPK